MVETSKRESESERARRRLNPAGSTTQLAPCIRVDGLPLRVDAAHPCEPPESARAPDRFRGPGGRFEAAAEHERHAERYSTPTLSAERAHRRPRPRRERAAPRRYSCCVA